MYPLDSTLASRMVMAHLVVLWSMLLPSCGDQPVASPDASAIEPQDEDATIIIADDRLWTSYADGSLRFNADINPILKASCAGSSCHSIGSLFGWYTDNQANFDRDARAVWESVMDRSMPPAKAAALDPDARAKLLGYVAFLLDIKPIDVDEAGEVTWDSQGGTDGKIERTYDLANLDYANDVSPILYKGCGSSQCHAPGSPNGVFVSYQDKYLGWAGKAIPALRSGAMPPPGGTRTITDTERQVLIRYLEDFATAAQKDPNVDLRLNLSFAADINPIIIASCGTAGGCHVAGSTTRRPYENSEANVRADASGILYHLNRGSMPTGGATITAGEKQLLIDYLTH